MFPTDEAKELYKIRIMHVQAVAIDNTTQLLFAKRVFIWWENRVQTSMPLRRKPSTLNHGLAVG